MGPKNDNDDVDVDNPESDSLIAESGKDDTIAVFLYEPFVCTSSNYKINYWKQWNYELWDRNVGLFHKDLEGLEDDGANEDDVPTLDQVQWFWNIQECLLPVNIVTIMFRVVFFTVTLYMFYVTIMQDHYDDARHEFLYYLTHWTLIVTVLYQLVVLLFTFGVVSAAHIDFLWGLYSLTLPLNVLISLMYWGLVYPFSEDELGFISVFIHGISCLFVIIDGFFLSTIPLRMKQVLFIVSFAFCFLFWSLIYGLVISHDNLYEVIDWDDHPLKTTIIVLILLFIFLPFIFSLLWLAATFTLYTRIYKQPLLLRQTMRRTTSSTSLVYGT